jgi:hypothetical protein
MRSFISPLFQLCILGAAVVAVWLVTVRELRASTSLSSTWIAVAVAPSVIHLALFYSLAVHMHHSLGAWPTSIGEQGFSQSLLVHADIATKCFACLIAATVFLWPIAFLLSFFLRSCRKCAAYLGVYFLTCIVTIGFMLLASSRYLNRWRD